MSLKVVGLNQILDDTLILKGIEVEFLRGEISIISGPNGSGKTTLLKSIMKLLPVKNKTVYLNKSDINRISIRDRAKLIGYVPQFSNNDFDFSVYEIVEMGRYPFKFQWDMNNNNQAVEKAMDLTNVSNFRDRKISSLSGGELQRVLLARALAVNPEYLILDEPSSNLDISHNIEIMKLIKSITKELNITTIMVLHDLNTIYKYGDKVVLLKKGEIKFEGYTSSVLTVENIKDVFDVKVEFINDSKGLKHIIINPLV